MIIYTFFLNCASHSKMFVCFITFYRHYSLRPFAIFDPFASLVLDFFRFVTFFPSQNTLQFRIFHVINKPFFYPSGRRFKVILHAIQGSTLLYFVCRYQRTPARFSIGLEPFAYGQFEELCYRTQYQ